MCGVVVNVLWTLCGKLTSGSVSEGIVNYLYPETQEFNKGSFLLCVWN